MDYIGIHEQEKETSQTGPQSWLPGSIRGDDTPHLDGRRLALDQSNPRPDAPGFLNVVRHVIREFDLRLDELHNDSTTVTFQGAYTGAYQEGFRRGFPTLEIKWGHNKDH